MTLSYWWMHWFWITFRIFVGVSEEIALTHSITPSVTIANPSVTDLVQRRTGKAIGISNSTPPINNNNPSSNSSMQANISASKSQKPSSLKKLDFMYSNMTRQNATNKFYFPSKETTVINQNTTADISLNVTDNQMLINSSFSAINHTDSFNYINDTNYNQSLLLTSEKIIERDEDAATGNLSAAGITGITLGCVVIVGIICGVSYFLYRNRGFNRPQVLNDRCSNPDSSGYIDDASDNSEEMYSLDNDSFLNSLEAMTIQNYWTDTVKHTKL
ncbi:uncharacterized protein LOC659832 isoform X2 [Tribolium castaneum]|uniref:uncharacterized protein LOC659832 isoform X2 n=1 Tax=Tribolium castaneum TaxID=7070 RepID=UPI00077DE109|nr:PREDICTED: uncharacterized protein LOC659832 isoform X2 [Tribolium castaneum]|eukprot:XP_015840973.1 PREDICTED: uncharacterized protein LOC659832 isoform X2 [Tribolium castaneum]